jgi:twitching motility protein PilT
MIVNAAIRNLIRENKLFQIPSIMQGGRAEGQQLMRDAVKGLALNRKISKEEALRIANDPNLFDDESPRPSRPPAAR